jgi:hypothetical protein
MRLELIEISTQRPFDIKAYYDRYLLNVSGCSFLSSDAPLDMPLFYRGKLRNYNPLLVAPLLGGKNPYGERSCGIHACLNPTHIKDMV